jgi:CheY-like chemotaxis protein
MTILLVDDDSSVILALLPTLRGLAGHEVHAALSGEKALERAPVIGPIDLLITDVVMGAVDGFSLHEQLAAWYPAMRTIFISGYDLTEYGERLGSAQVLAKPFGAEALLEAVERELPANQAPAAPAAVDRGAAPGAESALTSAPSAESETDETPLVLGETIGGYRIISFLGQGRWGAVFLAMQTSINRPVGLKLLDPKRALDETQKQRFIADARAKAHVQHSGVLSVYEAGSADSWVFYTHEYVDGQSLAEMADSGRKIDEATTFKLLKTAADGLAYFAKNNIPHTPFQATDIFLAGDGQPRLSNLATQLADQPVSPEEEIEALGRALLAVVGPGPAISTTLRALLGRTLPTNPKRIHDWDTLLLGVKALEPKVVPLEAAKISAQERAAQVTLEKARRDQKRAFMINVIALLSLLVFAVVAVYFVWFR